MNRGTALLATLAVASTAAAAERVVLISWDGAPAWIVNLMIAEGRLPNLAKLSVQSQGMTSTFPSKTAVGHAAIFTGAWPGVNGISGNAVPLMPRHEHTILETRSGFDSRGLRVEPFYVTAAKQGKRVAILSATQAHPADPHVKALKEAKVPANRYIQWSGFESNIVPGRIWPLASGESQTIKLGDHEFRLTAQLGGVQIDGPLAHPKRRQETVRAQPARNDLTAWSAPFRVEKGDLFGQTYFRAYPRSGGGIDLYQRTVNGLVGAATRAQTEAYLEAYGGFHADPFGMYEDGAFGLPLYAGGDGEAERRVVELVRQDCEFQSRAFRYAWRTFRPDLVTQYTPMSDSAGHTWMGLLDPDSAAYVPTLAQRIRPYYEQVLQLQDEWLGDARAAAPNAVFVVVSDHGMAGVTKRFHVNAVLERAGLLKFDANGNIDLAQTKICAPPWADNALVVNDRTWKGGFVTLLEKPDVLSQAEAALLGARDSLGRPIVDKLFRTSEARSLGLIGPTTADLYFDLRPDFYPSTRPDLGTVSEYSLPRGAGVHGFWPGRTKMEAIFAMGGGRLRSASLGLVRQIDVAPTVAELLGLKPPAHYQGVSLVPR